MAITVVEVINTLVVANGPMTVTLATTPLPGDVVFLWYRNHRATTQRVVSTIVGLGGVWSLAAGGNGGVSFWKCTGATTAGNITVTQNSASPMSLTVYLVRGLTDTTATALTFGNANGGTGAPAVISHVAGKGQIVFGALNGIDATLAPFTYTGNPPATGWVKQAEKNDGINGIGAIHRIPDGAPETHTVTLVSQTVGDTIGHWLCAIGTLITTVDGPIAASPPAPVVALAADVVAPPTYTATIDASPPAPDVLLEATATAPPGPMQPGQHTVTVGGVDVSCLAMSVAIHHGRDDATGQPEASAVTMDLTTLAPGETLPPQVDVGAPVVVSTATPTLESVRFVGRVTDVLMGWEESGQDTPDSGVIQVVAVGELADLGRRVVGAVPYPQELDGARVARIMAAAGVTLDPLTSDPGTVQLLARDVDSAQALSTAHGAASSADGMVWQTRQGEIRYADSDHRRGVASAMTLDACNLLVTPSWRRNLEGLTNSVSLGYGTAPGGGGEQPRFVEAAPTSVARWGEYAYTATTELATLADATTMGRLLLARNSEPVWVMAALPVDTLGLTDTEYDALLELDMHSLLTLTGLPSLGTAPTTAVLWVEGWKETLTFGGHELELVVSGYCRTAPPPRWDDMDPTWTWDAGPAASLTWDTAACLGPPVNVGRWNDQPASLRWDQLAADLTWDTYTPGG